jgi:hypothetical protein
VKRHPALEPLSRDHHQALVVALRLEERELFPLIESSALKTSCGGSSPT